MAFLTSLLFVAAAHAPAEAPANMVGEWRYGTVSGTTYWDSSTGAYTGHGGGRSDTYIFAKDGTYKEYFYMEISPVAGYTTQCFTQMEGKYAVEGDTLKLTVTSGKYTVRSNRIKSQNYDRPMTDEEVKKGAKSYRFTMETRNGRSAMVLHLGKEEIQYDWVEKKAK